ncbi:Uncharacterized protein DAT39_010768, partial [Clarias magur]
AGDGSAVLQASSRHDRPQQLLPAHFKESTALTEWRVLQLNLTLALETRWGCRSQGRLSVTTFISETKFTTLSNS